MIVDIVENHDFHHIGDHAGLGKSISMILRWNRGRVLTWGSPPLDILNSENECSGMDVDFLSELVRVLTRWPISLNPTSIECPDLES